MKSLPRPPATYESFTQRHPLLKTAWEAIAEAGKQGPLDEPTQRLVKLGIAIGAMREGAVHAGVRKARALGIDGATLQQIVALAAGTLGLPGTVAVYSWVEDVLEAEPPRTA